MYLEDYKYCLKSKQINDLSKLSSLTIILEKQKQYRGVRNVGLCMYGLISLPNKTGYPLFGKDNRLFVVEEKFNFTSSDRINGSLLDRCSRRSIFEPTQLLH